MWTSCWKQSSPFPRPKMPRGEAWGFDVFGDAWTSQRLAAVCLSTVCLGDVASSSCAPEGFFELTLVMDGFVCLRGERKAFPHFFVQRSRKVRSALGGEMVPSPTVVALLVVNSSKAVAVDVIAAAQKEHERNARRKKETLTTNPKRRSCTLCPGFQAEQLKQMDVQGEEGGWMVVSVQPVNVYKNYTRRMFPFELQDQPNLYYEPEYAKVYASNEAVSNAMADFARMTFSKAGGPGSAFVLENAASRAEHQQIVLCNWD
uniref:Uncharacterized protein n=1 Tax=Chromera velia CCMP2878 TaxID=1169474 RepID=A0A0G4FKC5_9ALVE|eukprot:Cvel_17331.t1-p1 / transcript=Cvel_17331.t1 / gene=Cvel_17331 / organism=Chromera_velia_CCMP2878 / gene_product=hypothetical protein / transcript_product=hypothetical protein / location=Cvel_scaffold1377:4033-12547(+) / protein_length=259 / sequence_SO=supercontig / SO=protein_coding / is_pseudo=false